MGWTQVESRLGVMITAGEIYILFGYVSIIKYMYCTYMYMYTITWLYMYLPQPACGLLDTTLSDESSDEEYDPMKDTQDTSKDTEVLVHMYCTQWHWRL